MLEVLELLLEALEEGDTHVGVEIETFLGKGAKVIVPETDGTVDREFSGEEVTHP